MESYTDIIFEVVSFELDLLSSDLKRYDLIY